MGNLAFRILFKKKNEKFWNLQVVKGLREEIFVEFIFAIEDPKIVEFRGFYFRKIGRKSGGIFEIGPY